MKKILLTLILGMFLISLISSFDQQLQNCFGDGELIICYSPSDRELIWLAGGLPEERGWSGSGAGADHLTQVEPPEEIPPLIEPIPAPTFFSILGLDKIKYGVELFFLFMFLLILWILIYIKNKEKRLVKKIKEIKK